MKPRLESATLTQEDLDVWISIGHLVRPSRKHFGDVLSGMCYLSDRSDANLMFMLANNEWGAMRFSAATCGLPYWEIESILDWANERGME